MGYFLPDSWKLGYLEDKILARNGADSLDELTDEQLDREIRVAKSLVQQAKGRKEEPKFKLWLQILERTKSGEEFALLNQQKKDHIINMIANYATQEEVEDVDDIYDYVKQFVRTGKVTRDEYHELLNSEELKDIIADYLHEGLSDTNVSKSELVNADSISESYDEPTEKSWVGVYGQYEVEDLTDPDNDKLFEVENMEDDDEYYDAISYAKDLANKNHHVKVTYYQWDDDGNDYSDSIEEWESIEEE